MPTDKRCWVVIAGGGTAGHVLPGLGIAAEIVKRGTSSRMVRWVGSRRGVETRLVPEAGFRLSVLSGRGLQRRLTFANVTTVFKLLGSFVQAWRLLGRYRPAIIVGLGGYASVACGMAAAVRRIPLIVMEQNAVAGAANRLLSYLATCSAVAFPHTKIRGARWVGNPVRSDILEVDRTSGRSNARLALGVEDNRHLVVVFGGSLGARSINTAVAQAVSAEIESSWRYRDDMHLIHISGHREYTEVKERVPDRRNSECKLVYDLLDYQDDMSTIYAAADLVICRAGATTAAELAATATPAVLVPLAGAPRDHQTANARVLVNAGAAVMIPDSRLDGMELIAEVDSLLADEDSLRSMSHAAEKLKQPNAASDIADLLEKHALRPRPGVTSQIS